MNEFYAHSVEGKSEDQWHPLVNHLYGTARKAGEFAAEFGAKEWGHLAGLWHDLGKYSPEFQKYIRAVASSDAHLETKPGRVDHSTAGALHALDKFGKFGRVLAYPIAGHHAGLADWQGDGGKSLDQRLAAHELLKRCRRGNIPDEIINHKIPGDRAKNGTDLSRSFWLRMLFSCVVDADFLDTEAFFDPDQAKQRGNYPELKELLPCFNAYMQEKQNSASNTKVNQLRAEILRQCIGKAGKPPGIYTLTVPTGGGKTLSSMAFALNHALVHGRQRVIYVIPYTSIIEQTAEEFRGIFGSAVVEHHSNLDSSDEAKETPQSRLACENWDAPVIVTTSVQFFESLFASRTSRCRKLHNIVNSVVIFDEAQLLPPDFLNPILETINELQLNYRVTAVFCTATQPALNSQENIDFNFKGLPGMVELMDVPDILYEEFKRTEIRALKSLQEAVSWDEIAGNLQNHEAALCIVNRRDDARILWEKMPRGTYHLSALMCGAHRSEKISEIKQRLKNGLPTRVISTQLVEAGVDLDFPVVYRALAGLDSIAQAAGRCNREGLSTNGDVFIFIPPSAIPAGHLQQAAEIGRRMLNQDMDQALSPERFTEFFREFYWLRGDQLDSENIIALLKNDPDLAFSFRTAAWKFKLIDETTYAPVIVRYENEKDIGLLLRHGPERWLLRKLQRHIVNLPRRQHGQLVASGAILEAYPGIFIQTSNNLYDCELGFCAEKGVVYEPDELMV